MRRIAQLLAGAGGLVFVLLMLALAAPHERAPGSGSQAASDVPSPISETATTAFVCPPTTNSFINQVCDLASSGDDWRAMNVPSDQVGPTPAMYAKLARAVLSRDTSACDDSQIVAFIVAGSHVDSATARDTCTTYFASRLRAGWFEISDPATADTIRIRIP